MERNFTVHPASEERLAALVDELRDSEERFRLAFEHHADGLALLNMDSRYVQANGAFCEMLGYAEAELLGRHFSDVTHSNDLKASFEQHRELRADPTQPVSRDMRFLRKDGHAAWARVTLVAVPDESGAPQYLLCQAQDTTEQRALELERQRIEEQVRRAQRMEAVGRLAGGVAHEFNNMLSIILNNLDFADRKLGDADVRPYLAAVRQASLHTSSLVRKLMIFGRCDIAPAQVVDVNASVGGLEEAIGRIAGDAIDVRLTLDPDAWRVYVAPEHLEQVVLNLVTNAREAMPGGGRVSIGTANVVLDEEASRARFGVRPGRYLQIVVDDTGRGMPQDVLARAFEPFFTTKQPGDGPGLGLAIAYGIVEEAGGHVHAESAPGAGTRVEVLLPATEMAARAATEDRPGPAARGRGETVLVVEDEPAVRELTCLILRENGYQVWTVDGPEQALQRLMNDQAPLDLLVTDVIMPRLSGTDLAAYVRALRPGAKVLFMSGRADEHIGRQRVRHKQVAFLQKPFDAEELLRAVREVLEPAARHA